MNKMLLHPKHWPSWLGAGMIWLLSLLPQVARYSLGKGLGALAYRYNHKRRTIVLQNLNYCFPNKTPEVIEEISRAHFTHLAMGFIDYSVLIFASKAKLESMVEIDKKEQIEGLINQGLLVLLLHSTFLDFTGPALSGYGPLGSYQPFKNPVIDFLVLRFRNKFASKLLSRKEGFKGIIKALKQKKMFVYLADEDMGAKHSVFTPFFSSTKATLTTASRLCHSTQCAAVVAMVVWSSQKKKYILKITDNLAFSGEIEDDARSLNQAIESLVQEDVAQYMWTMKFFRTRPEGEKSIY